MINRGFYKHVGIYIGPRPGDNRDVVHNDKSQGVILSTLAEFAGGTAVVLHRPASGDYFQRQAIANRAMSLLGMDYDLWKFNCEHAATWAQTGSAKSPQLAAVLVSLVLILLLAIFIVRES